MPPDHEELILELNRLMHRGQELRQEYEDVLEEFLKIQKQLRLLREAKGALA